MDEETQDLAKQNKKPPTIVKEHINMMEEDSPKIMPFGLTNNGEEEAGNTDLQQQQSLGKRTWQGKIPKGWRMMHQQ